MPAKFKNPNLYRALEIITELQAERDRLNAEANRLLKVRDDLIWATRCTYERNATHNDLGNAAGITGSGAKKVLDSYANAFRGIEDADYTANRIETSFRVAVDEVAKFAEIDDEATDEAATTVDTD